jgi:hypothetical protein
MKKHYYLVSGEVFFHGPVQENATREVGSLKLNSVITLNRNQVVAREMGRAQQALQLRFHERMKDASLEVFDVFLISFSYLGHMTHEQFTADVMPITAEESSEGDQDLPSFTPPTKKGAFD